MARGVSKVPSTRIFSIHTLLTLISYNLNSHSIKLTHHIKGSVILRNPLFCVRPDDHYVPVLAGSSKNFIYGNILFKDMISYRSDLPDKYLLVLCYQCSSDKVWDVYNSFSSTRLFLGLLHGGYNFSWVFSYHYFLRQQVSNGRLMLCDMFVQQINMPPFISSC